MPAEIPIETLTTAEEVRGLAETARAEGQIALDTEFLWERTYAPQLCLLQVATRARVAIIDPFEGTPVGPIAEVAADPAVEVVMHAPSADLLLFALRESTEVTNVFDTQVAAGFVGLGIGMGYERLVDAALDVQLQHNETFSDWKRRPLSPTQIAYAADDVRYLLPLADEIRGRLERLGRAEWLADELARRYGERAVVPDPDRAYLKVSRKGRLSPRHLAVLRELAAWREREARRRDMPTGWLVKDPSLVELARAGASDAASLKRVRGLGSLRPADLDGLLGALRKGAEGEPIRQPREPQGDVARRAATGAALASLLVRARCDAADIAPELVANRADLEDLARQAAGGTLGDDHVLLRGWRGDLVGKELVDLLEGRVALAASWRPPHLIAVPLEDGRPAAQ